MNTASRSPAPRSDGPQEPIISVIVPTHDYARYLPEAIGSLQAQTFQEWECVVVDDGSTDDTPVVLAGLAATDPRIRTFVQQQRGPAAARNHALREARGRYVQFLDADDLLHPAKLADHLYALETESDVDIVYGPTMYFDPGTPDVTRHATRDPGASEPRRLSGTGRDVLDVLLRDNVVTIEAPLVRRSVFETVGQFDEGIGRMEDWEFWLRCALAGHRFAYLASDHPVASIRAHGASLSHRELDMRLAEIPIRRGLRGRLSDPGAWALNERRLAEVSAETAITLALQGEVTRGLRLLVPAGPSLRPRTWLVWSAALLVAPVRVARARVVSLRAGRRRRSAA